MAAHRALDHGVLAIGVAADNRAGREAQAERLGKDLRLF